MRPVVKCLKMYGRSIIFGGYDFRWGKIVSVTGQILIEYKEEMIMDRTV